MRRCVAMSGVAVAGISSGGGGRKADVSASASKASCAFSCGTSELSCCSRAELSRWVSSRPEICFASSGSPVFFDEVSHCSSCATVILPWGTRSAAKAGIAIPTSINPTSISQVAVFRICGLLRWVEEKLRLGTAIRRRTQPGGPPVPRILSESFDPRILQRLGFFHTWPHANEDRRPPAAPIRRQKNGESSVDLQVRPAIDLGSGMMSAPHKPLSALLSQTLVAYSVELDCEFERRMLQTQSRSARLSLVIWLNLLRFLVDGPVSVRTLASRALTAEAGATAGLGCLERWGVLALHPGKRAGFGSGRGIRADWPVRLTASGEAAVGIWPGLIPEIDARWSKRFGDHATRLRRSLEAIEHQLDLELPQGLPVAILKLPEFGPRKSAAEDGLPLPALLSRVLLAFALDF